MPTRSPLSSLLSLLTARALVPASTLPAFRLAQRIFTGSHPRASRMGRTPALNPTPSSTISARSRLPSPTLHSPIFPLVTWTPGPPGSMVQMPQCPEQVISSELMRILISRYVILHTTTENLERPLLTRAKDTVSNAIGSGQSLFNSAFDATKAAVGGKPVWITETGWPVSGPTRNLAVASVDNAKTYWDEVGCSNFGVTNTWW